MTKGSIFDGTRHIAGLSCETCGHYNNYNEGLKEDPDWYEERKCECECHMRESK